MTRFLASSLLALVLSAFVTPCTAQPHMGVNVGPDGRLVYTPDSRGNVVTDFSHAGYEGGGVSIPDVPARIFVGPGGNARARIQAAIDIVSGMTADARGFRGAVLIGPGTYEIDGALRIATSGVVLRGSGTGDTGTTLVATSRDRGALVTVSGRGERLEIEGTRRAVSDAYVPAGSRELTAEHAGGLHVGDRVAVVRPSTKEWIAALGMDAFVGWRPDTRLNWRPGSRDLVWERRVTAIDGNRVTLDAPITTALDATSGGGAVFRYAFEGRIDHVGIENVRLVSRVDPARPVDEDHAWVGISIDKVEDAWVRRVVARQFASYAVIVGGGARGVTVEDVEALDPVSEIGGQRRRVFFTAGQQTLFQRCTSRGGRHDFGVGHAAAGPNVFLDARAEEALDFSGGLESWASGVLFDNVIVRGDAIRFINRDQGAQGAGWTVADSVIWNAEATEVEVDVPPGAYNLAYGCRGTAIGDGVIADPRAQPNRDFHRGTRVLPRSLYLTQLAERLGAAAVERLAAKTIPTSAAGIRELTSSDVPPSSVAAPGPALRVENGRFLLGDTPAWTSTVQWSWFQAQMPAALAAQAGPAITRFAPGRVGTGLTDDLETVVRAMPPGAAFYQYYGLWYDRRRVNHNFDGSAERRTGDVWAPFMELPWARSGTGKAWDGLSKYDLTRFNPWFFDRVKTFADLADRHGRVLYYSFYFQHWLAESRSHYVDFPWRPANCLQATDLPDDNPAGAVFYDVSHEVRRDLHRRYIRHVLDTLGRNPNTVFGIDREYTGPLQFVQFWLDTIAEWQRETGLKVRIALEIPKDQLDAILADPMRAPMVAALDVHHWLYKADGSLFAVRGGLDRAPREQRPDIATQAELDALKAKLGAAFVDTPDFRNGPEFQKLFDTLWASSAAMKYRTLREYRDQYPDLVVLTYKDDFPQLTRAVEAAVPAVSRAGMRPLPLVRAPVTSAWASGRAGDRLLVYTMEGAAVDLDLSGDPTAYELRWVDAESGGLHRTRTRIAGGKVVTLTPPVSATARPWVAWMVKAVR
jgi:hypothetical protein